MALARAASIGGAALARWTNAGEPNRMARVKAAVRVFMISLHAESDLHGRRVTSHERCEPSEVCQISANLCEARTQGTLQYRLLSIIGRRARYLKEIERYDPQSRSISET